MDKDTIQKIAEAIAPHLSSHTTTTLILQVVLVLLAAAIGGFFGEYFRTRGKHVATKADFDSLKEQLRANTELTETIKTEIGREDWTKREWINLRRLKLEELLQRRLDCHEYLIRFARASIDAELFPEFNPLFSFEVILTLYFAELQTPGSAFMQQFETVRKLIQEFNSATIHARGDGVAKSEAGKKLSTEMQKAFPALVDAGDKLTSDARGLLMKIMDVGSGGDIPALSC